MLCIFVCEGESCIGVSVLLSIWMMINMCVRRVCVLCVVCLLYLQFLKQTTCLIAKISNSSGSSHKTSHVWLESVYELRADESALFEMGMEQPIKNSVIV